MHPIEQRIRKPHDSSVSDSMRDAFPNKTDQEIIAELTRMVVLVAVCYSDIVEGGQDPYEILRRYIFEECDELAGYFPWPPE
jgi:hypothetical protein